MKTKSVSFSEKFGKKCIVCEKTDDLIQVGSYYVCFECECIDSDSRIHGYYYKPSPKFHGRGKKQFGVELEVYPAINTRLGKIVATYAVIRAFNGNAYYGEEFENSCYLKKDGSLNEGHGFEIVFHPHSFSKIALQQNLFSVLSSLPIKSFQYGSTGLHIHVSKVALSASTQAKLTYFFTLPENEKFLTTVAGRDWNDYCLRVTPRGHDRMPYKRWVNGNHERHSALNFQNSHTVEFRLFKGNAKPSNVTRQIEFVDAITVFCSKFGAHNMNWKVFVDFINKSYWSKNKRLLTFVNKFAKAHAKYAEEFDNAPVVDHELVSYQTY